MKALETFYNGYRFRSRLEARWAVFFDALPLAYDYESQGFVLENSLSYLPDFFVPDWETYVEIKPAKPDQAALDIFTTFTREKSLLIFYGNCYRASYGVIGRLRSRYADAPEFVFNLAALHRCKECQTGWWIGGNQYGDSMYTLQACGCPASHWTNETPQIGRAYEYARGARFEHGESGAPRGMTIAHHRRPPAPTPISPEYALIWLLCHNGPWLEQVQDQLSPEDFHDADLRNLYRALIKTASDSEGKPFRALLDAAATPRQSQLLTQIAMKSPLMNPAEIAASLNDCVTKIRTRKPKAMRQRVIEQLCTVARGSAEQQRLLQEYHRLSKEPL